MHDVNDLRSYWADYPPVHLIEAAKLGMKPRRRGPRAPPSAATLAAFGGVKRKG